MRYDRPGVGLSDRELRDEDLSLDAEVELVRGSSMRWRRRGSPWSAARRAVVRPGTPEDVAELLSPYLDASCSAVNVISCAADDETAIAAVGALRALLAGSRSRT